MVTKLLDTQGSGYIQKSMLYTKPPPWQCILSCDTLNSFLNHHRIDMFFRYGQHLLLGDLFRMFLIIKTNFVEILCQGTGIITSLVFISDTANSC